jgi:hypothetical protein
MTQQPFLALITPIGEGASQPPVSGGQPGYPTHPWVPPYGPAHPIAPGGPPPGIWGPIGNYPDAGFPGPQPGGPVYPSQPIYRPDLGFWGGSAPGVQPQPPMGGAPSHPIYYPPVIWDPSRPTNPITNPGDPNHPEGDRTPKVEWKSAWSPSTGWIVVGVPTGEHVTPSSEQNDQ